MARAISALITLVAASAAGGGYGDNATPTTDAAPGDDAAPGGVSPHVVNYRPKSFPTP